VAPGGQYIRQAVFHWMVQALEWLIALAWLLQGAVHFGRDVIATIAPEWKHPLLPLTVQSRRDDLKVAHDVSPGLELVEKTSPGGTAESIPLQPSLRDWPNC
jgi:hypothetical protein